MPTLLLSKQDVLQLINMKGVLAVVEKAFVDFTEGKGEMPSKVALTQWKLSSQALYTVL